MPHGVLGIVSRTASSGEGFVMGDKGGKKDKQKSQKQKASKQAQSAKQKQDKNRPK